MSPVTMHVYGIGRGRVIRHVQTNSTENVTPRSSVFASVAEVEHAGYQTPQMGDARMYVCNVAPGQGYVDVWVQVDWASDLPFRLTLLIIP